MSQRLFSMRFFFGSHDIIYKVGPEPVGIIGVKSKING